MPSSKATPNSTPEAICCPFDCSKHKLDTTAIPTEESSGENGVPSPAKKRLKMTSNGKGKASMSSDFPDCNIDSYSEKGIRNRRNDAWWDLPTICTLLELMYVHFQNGQLLSSTFSDQIWRDIAKEMQDRTRIQYNIGQLKGKACRLRMLWRKFHDLITNRTGFGWDPLTCTVTAPKECWAIWTKENPKEASLRKKGLPHYHICTEIFLNSTATGSLARSSAMDTCDSDEDTKFDGSHRGIDLGPTTNLGSSSLGNLGTHPTFTSTDSPISSGGMRVNEKKTSKSYRFSRIDHALDAWASVNSAKVQKLATRATHSVENCMVALKNMEGLSNVLFFKAQDALMSKTHCKMFLLMSDTERRAWVESLADCSCVHAWSLMLLKFPSSC